MAQPHTVHTPGYLPKWMENLSPNKNPDVNVYRNFINNHQKVDAVVWILFLPPKKKNPYFEILMPITIVLGGGTFGGNEIMRVEFSWIALVPL